MSEELVKYYNNIIKMTNELKEQKKFNEAINIINEELQAPYIPSEFEVKLSEILTEITYELNDQLAENKFLKMSKNELFERILKNEASAIYALMILFEKYKDEISKKDISEFKKILSSTEYTNDLKIVLLENLKANNFRQSVQFYSQSTDEIYEINLEYQKFVNEEKMFVETFAKLKQLYDDDPMTSELANNMVFAVYNHYFPNFDEVKSTQNLVVGIVQALKSILSNEDEQQQTKLCKKILEIMKTQEGDF